VTGLAAVPPLWIQLMDDHSPFPQRSFPRLRYITSSGGVFPAPLVDRYRKALPHASIYLMYGLSEAFRSTYLPPAELGRRPSSIGRAIPETELHVLDEQGRECAPGEIGELVHRGPTVALGYWNDPDATARVFRPCPFPGARAGERVVFSGDLVERDDEGYLFFIGRRDQLLKVWGHRVSAEEVEAAVFDSGAVSEVAARGVPDPVAGQAIVVHVVPRRPETFSPDDLLAWCRREMPPYLVPKTVVVHDALPRTASGKLDRKWLAG
jgi:acyl-CoA synthetase (AMP-forming)/AMP-acid ligase II